MRVAMLRRDIYCALTVMLMVSLRHLKMQSCDSFAVFVQDTDDNIKWRTALFSEPDCREEIAYFLKLFDRRGHFDN